MAGFLSRQKSYAMKQQPFPIYYEKSRLEAAFTRTDRMEECAPAIAFSA
jgi:hypothetical protein